ncbi:hypothetical protein [Pantoea anthophila]|uniref:hypothetical protein n=1 Tax=Pantoea anthophila TaxID=470931 RepID=UPI00277DA9B4|nr:hypothetical protein [Pantoea anthophila]MDQ1213048.1 hypothetical protein [Pantoea anthophila]
MSGNNSNISQNTANTSENESGQEGQHNGPQGSTTQTQFGAPVSGPPDPSFPLANLPESTQTVQQRAENHEDRRNMRKWLFIFIVGASFVFLLLGGGMAVVVTCNLLTTKSEVKTAMIKVVDEASPSKIGQTVFQVQPLPPESFFHARENAKEISMLAASQRNSLIEKFLESTNWLSLTPMITLIAFILGVGLTLAIALMRALFKEEAEEKTNTLAQVCTPLSKLIEYLGEYIKSKFNSR